MAVLAHTRGAVHEAHYDEYERLRGKRIALETSQRHILQVLGEATTAIVVPITRARA
jgi:hypothetical protein